VSKAFVVRYEMRPDSAEENQRLIENVFAELAEKQPDGIQYACFRLDDGETFVHVGVSSDDSNALSETAAFQEFQKAFGDRAATPPVASGATLVGMYGFDR
jgi:hypothetical protein